MPARSEKFICQHSVVGWGMHPLKHSLTSSVLSSKSIEARAMLVFCLLMVKEWKRKEKLTGMGECFWRGGRQRTFLWCTQTSPVSGGRVCSTQGHCSASLPTLAALWYQLYIWYWGALVYWIGPLLKNSGLRKGTKTMQRLYLSWTSHWQLLSFLNAGSIRH